MRTGERRQSTPSLDEAKFVTQKVVTLIILLIFAAVTANVLVGADQAERSTILQTVINLTILAVGYWLGASKAASDSNAVMGQIASGAAPSTAAALAAAKGATPAAPPPEPKAAPDPQQPKGIAP